MTTNTSKAVALALLALLLVAGGVVGFVIGKRQAATTAVPQPAAQVRLKRFTKRLNLTDEQRATVGKVLSETRDAVATAKARGQERILEILDDEQKARYQKMLERQKQRRAKRGKRGKKRRKRDKR